MDSGNNSGSLHSSSGADEECDSRTDVRDSGLITTHHLTHQPPPRFNHHQNQLNNTNPLLFSSQHHHLLNLDSVLWSNTLPSFSEQTNVPSKIPTVPGMLVQSTEGGMITNLINSHVVSEDREAAASNTYTSNTTTMSTNPIPPPRNPKKRSRASRRAPTTVLTTDTHNFRAMVQEFTGIPSSPFTSSSSGFPNLTTSLDLFNRSSTLMRSNTTNNFDHNLNININTLPSYLLPPRQYSSLIDHSCNLLNTMQNPINFPYNPLNIKPIENPNPSHGFGVIGQTNIHEHHSTTLPDLLSTAATPTTTSSRNDDPVVSGNWDGGGGGGGDNFNNGKDLI